MSELAMLSLRDVAPLGIPASLPVPPAPSGGDFSFDQHLAEATQRQQAEVEPREEATPREPEGEYRRLELPHSEDRVRDPERELHPRDGATLRGPEVPQAPADRSAPGPVPPANAANPPVDPAVIDEKPGIAPIEIAPPIVSTDAPSDVATDPAADVAALALLAPTANPSGTWQQPALNELFPEYFAGLPQATAPVATATAPPADGSQLPMNAAGAPLGLTVPHAEQPDAAPIEIATLTPRERRYGFGIGKPFQGHAAVNRRNIDRFGREITLPTAFVARTIAASSTQLPLIAKTAEVAPQITPTIGMPVSDDALPVNPLANPIPVNDKSAPEIPVTDDETPTFGSQVAYKTQAVHLRATTPGFGDQQTSDQSADQPPNGEAQQQSAIATAPKNAIVQDENVASADFNKVWKNAIAPPISDPEPTAIRPNDAIPLKDPLAAPINLNGITAAITRGTGESTGTGEAPPARETVAFRNIAADLTAKLSKEAVPEGATRLRVTLRPRELGTITIELIRQGDQLETRITTRTKEAQALFEKLMPELKVQLEERGFNVRSLDLTHQQQLDQNNQGQASRDWARPNHGWERPPLPRPLLEIPEAENGELDLRDIADGINLTV